MSTLRAKRALTRLLYASPAILSFLFLSGCGPSSNKGIATYATFPLALVLTDKLLESGEAQLPESVIGLSLPIQGGEYCPNMAFFPEVTLTRIDVEPVATMVIEKMDPDTLEKEARQRSGGQEAKVQGFLGKRPEFDKIKEAALQKLKRVKGIDILERPSNRLPDLVNDLKTIVQRNKPSRIFAFSPAVESLPVVGNGLETHTLFGLQLAAIPDKDKLMQSITKELCQHTRDAAKGSEVPGFVVLYNSKTGASSANVPSTPGKKQISVEAQQHLQQGMTYISLAKASREKKQKGEDYDNAVLEFSQAIDIETARQSCYSNAYMNRGIAQMLHGNFNRAEIDLTKAAECDRGNATVQYNLAALYSLQNKRDLALDALARALDLGFNDCGSLRADSDLASIRTHPEFRTILETHRMFCF